MVQSISNCSLIELMNFQRERKRNVHGYNTGGIFFISFVYCRSRICIVSVNKLNVSDRSFLNKKFTTAR